MYSGKRKYVFTALAACIEDDEEAIIAREIFYNNVQTSDADSLLLPAFKGYSDILGNSRRKIARIEDFHITIGRYHPDQFQTMFRLSRAAFSNLLDQIKSNVFVPKARNNGGKQLEE
jgi:hypothetical protein